MTSVQEQQIRDLRMRGVGYKAIATITGLTRDIVRNYCKRQGFQGLGNEVTLNVREQIKQGLACQGCGKPLTQPKTGRKRRFCSDTCRRAWWSAHPESLRRKDTAYYRSTCANCGKSFLAYGNNHRKYCSHDCYIQARFGKGK